MLHCLRSVPAVISLLAASLIAPAVASDRPAEACGDYGTAITFCDSPKEAANLARKQQKLVFILHVSGHFEDPGVT